MSDAVESLLAQPRVPSSARAGSRWPALKLLFAMATAAGLCGSAVAVPPTASPDASAPAGAASAPAPAPAGDITVGSWRPIKCAYVLASRGATLPTQETASEFADRVAKANATASSVAKVEPTQATKPVPRADAPGALPQAPASFCPRQPHMDTLVPDDGYMVVVVAADDFYAASRSKPSTRPWQLSLDGKSLSSSGFLDAQIVSGDEAMLRFRVATSSSAGSQEFWTSAYQKSGFGKAHPLTVEVGWDGMPEFFRPDPAPGKDDVSLAQKGSDDSLKVTDQSLLGVAVFMTALLLLLFGWAMWRTSIFRIGTVPQGDRLLAFSFAKVQWGVWNCFTLTAALYLWAVFGNFPSLQGSSVFVLSAVSTLTATTSFFIDSSKPAVLTVSQGLLRDLLSGNNNDVQAHRFQALLVNGMLLLAGIFYVYHDLAYPVFDTTWMAMLGISNAAQLAGKQLLENKPSAATGAPVTNAPAAGPVTASPAPAATPASPPPGSP